MKMKYRILKKKRLESEHFKLTWKIYCDRWKRIKERRLQKAYKKLAEMSILFSDNIMNQDPLLKHLKSNNIPIGETVEIPLYNVDKIESASKTMWKKNESKNNLTFK